jgi:hypothetical protein
MCEVWRRGAELTRFAMTRCGASFLCMHLIGALRANLRLVIVKNVHEINRNKKWNDSCFIRADKNSGEI